jgi:hypothetical protein
MQERRAEDDTTLCIVFRWLFYEMTLVVRAQPPTGYMGLVNKGSLAVPFALEFLC